jgi:hypothetical protein
MAKIPTDFDILRYSASFGARHPSQLLSRETVREISCPDCHALPGHPCRGVSGLRERNHMGRCFERIRLLMVTQPEVQNRLAAPSQIEDGAALSPLDEVALSPEEWQKLSSSPPPRRVQSKS